VRLSQVYWISTQLHSSNKYTPAVKLECIFLCSGPDQMPGNSDTAVYLQTVAIVSQRLKGKLVWVVYATTGGNMPRRVATGAWSQRQCVYPVLWIVDLKPTLHYPVYGQF